MTILKFPANYTSHRYSPIHYSFFLQYAKVAGVEIQLVNPNRKIFIPPKDQLFFSCTINDQQVIFDYADHSTRNWKDLNPDVKYFKFQTTANNPPEMIPLGPPMIGLMKMGPIRASLDDYNQLRRSFKYQPGQRVLCKQNPYGNALERRRLVRSMLTQAFNKATDISHDTPQIEFWKAHERCLVSVCVPGATNNMVDRGQMELMGLGVCTVSPRLDTLFPHYQHLIPDTHYIQCADDYSDLVEKIKELQQNKQLCREVGNNAQKFYDQYFSPIKYWNWIEMNL